MDQWSYTSPKPVTPQRYYKINFSTLIGSQIRLQYSSLSQDRHNVIIASKSDIRLLAVRRLRSAANVLERVIIIKTVLTTQRLSVCRIEAPINRSVEAVGFYIHVISRVFQIL